MRTALAATALLLLAVPAKANDSIAEIGAGGLILVQADYIRMEKEDLYISPSRVKVDYVFRNTDSKDHIHIVAFPMPDIDPIDYMESDNGIPDQNADNFMKFSVTVEGKSITPQLEMRAVVAGIDLTDELKALNLPLNPLSEAARAAVKKLPPDTLLDLQVMGAVRMDDDYIDPAWSLRATYYWRQEFPANAAINVSHTYTPAVGGSFFTATSADDAYYKDTYCLDAGTIAALRKKLASLPEDRRMLMTTSIAYILTTGSNWMGPIGDFRLVVDKERPDAIVSFCESGVKKIAPTQFEVLKRDIYPEKDLKVLVINALPVE
jgi:Domain of unknown function (DUF4424)